MKKITLFFILVFIAIVSQAQSSNRLDSLYCYDYNIGSEDYDLTTKKYYTYLIDTDLVIEYLEQEYLSHGIWQNQVRQLHQYDDNGQVIETIQQHYEEEEEELVNDLKTTFSYDSDLKRSTNIQFRWNEITETWILDIRKNYSYENNVLTTVLIQKYDTDTDTWLNRFRELSAYDEEQRITEKTTKIWMATTWQNYTSIQYLDWIGAVYTKELKQAWQENTQTWTNEQQVFFNYENNLLVQENHQNWNPQIQVWDNVSQSHFSYNNQQELSATFRQDWTIVAYHHQPLSRTLRSFSEGQLSEERQQNWNENSQDWFDTERSTFSYDDNANIDEHLVESWDTLGQNWTPVNRYLHDYDSLNYVSQIIKQQPAGDQFVDIIRRDYEHDVMGNLLKETVYFFSNGWILYSEDTYEYNELGQLAIQTAYFINFSTNVLIPNDRKVFFYHENGQRVKQHEEWWSTATETWDTNIRELSTYDGNGKLKRALRQSLNFMQEWEDGHQILYQYDENTHLTDISLERFQASEWFLVEKTNYQNDINGRADSATYQIFEDEQYQYFKWLYTYDEQDKLVLEEFQQQTSPIYDWVDDHRCAYFRSLMTSIAELRKPTLSCVFPNPYRSGRKIECGDLDNQKKYQARVYQLSGQLLYQSSFTGNAFAMDVKWGEGLYILGVFEKGKVIGVARIWMSP